MSLMMLGLDTLLGMDAQGSAAMARYNATLQNQKLNDLRAADALRRGSYEAGLIRMRASQVEGAQRTAYGASGVDANVGSAAALQASTAGQGELDALMAKNNATRAAWGYKVNAFQDMEQGAATLQSNSDAQEGAMLGEAAGDMGQLASFGMGLDKGVTGTGSGFNYSPPAPRGYGNYGGGY